MESLKGDPLLYSAILETPAASLEPCVLASTFPVDHFIDVKRGDLLLGLGNSSSSIDAYPGFAHFRVHLGQMANP